MFHNGRQASLYVKEEEIAKRICQGPNIHCETDIKKGKQEQKKQSR